MGIAPSLAEAVHRPIAGPLPSPAAIVEGFERHDLLTRASAIAFRTLFALVPFSLFLLALAGLLSLESLWTENLTPEIRPAVSPALFTVLDDTARNVLGHGRLFWVTAGFALVLWELSGAVRAVMGG